jgi:hypothetical protein
MLLAAAYFGKQFKSMKPALFGKAVPRIVAFIAILLIVRGLA